MVGLISKAPRPSLGSLAPIWLWLRIHWTKAPDGQKGQFAEVPSNEATPECETTLAEEGLLAEVPTSEATPKCEMTLAGEAAVGELEL
jgi:hypothetical protein